MPDLSFDTSTLINTADLEAEPLALPGLASGLMALVLRRTDDGHLRSAVVDLPAGWSSGPCAGAVGHQGYVLAGTLHDGENTLAPGTFFFHPPGHAFDWRCDQSVRLVLILNGPQSYAGSASRNRSPEAIPALRPESVPVTPSTIEGRPTGVIRRVLWQDSATGADTRHLTIPAGVSGLGAEWHPCNEEIYCLTRDTTPGDDGALRAGCFLFNPAYAVHGGNRTVNAAEMTLLEWHDGLWEIHRHAG
jgi:hypothetical protein